MTPGASLSGTWQIPAIAYIEDYRIGGSWLRVSPQIQPWWGYTAEESGTPNFWKTCLHPGDRDGAALLDQVGAEVLRRRHRVGPRALPGDRPRRGAQGTWAGPREWTSTVTSTGASCAT